MMFKAIKTSALHYLIVRCLVFSYLGFGLNVIAQPQTLQNWTLQLGAYGDYRDAQTFVDQLIASGFDAYSEFYMQDAKQLVRVRVGCFDSKETADTFRPLLTNPEVLAAPLSENAPIGLCRERSIGFITPNDWGIQQAGASHVDFWVKLADISAYLRFDGQNWLLLQPSDYTVLAAETPATGYFQEDATGVIRLYYPNLSLLTLTSGKIIWQNALSAVILEGGSLVAYKLTLVN